MYAAVDAIVAEGIASIVETCRYLSVNRTAFYAWRHSEPTVTEEKDAALAPLIRVIFRKHKRRYGVRRIARELRKRELTCSERRVARVMKTLGLRAIQPKSFVPKTTDSRHRLGYSPNLLLEAKSPDRCDEVWLGDITYIGLIDGTFCYLSVLMDLFSRRIIAWTVRDDMCEGLVLETLRKAIRLRQPTAELIHHTDRGGQYAGNAYRAVLRRAEIRQSMSRPDNCYDNAFMESGFGTIKTELEMTEYKSIREAQKEIGEYIRYYNFDRMHSSLEYLTPAEFEQLNHHSK